MTVHFARDYVTALLQRFDTALCKLHYLNRQFEQWDSYSSNQMAYRVRTK